MSAVHLNAIYPQGIEYETSCRRVIVSLDHVSGVPIPW